MRMRDTAMGLLSLTSVANGVPPPLSPSLGPGRFTLMADGNDGVHS